MGYLGKRKMNSTLSRETGIPYRDVAVYGRYRKERHSEKLEIGAYFLFHDIKRDYAILCEPDFSHEEPKYKKRQINLKGGDENVY